jgi:hypothetical protein
LRKVGIGPFGADRWPCATGLVSYPFKLLFSSHADDSLFEALHDSDLIAVPWSSPFPGAFHPDRSLRGSLIHFHIPAATPERFSG